MKKTTKQGSVKSGSKLKIGHTKLRILNSQLKVVIGGAGGQTYNTYFKPNK